MCSLTRNLLRFNRIFEGSSFPARRVVAARRSIHINERLLNSDDDNNAKKFTNPDEDEVMSSEIKHNLHAGMIPTRYKLFRDEDSSIIFDVDEEREKINLKDINAPIDEPDPLEGINLEHGITGVYDLDDLVDLLRRNNVMEIFVASVPPEFAYVDYVITVTGRSPKHMKATAELIRRVFKKKRRSEDILPKVEGKNSKDWIALDLGNIVLHIFSQQARKAYDLETLWTVGSKYDDQSNEPVDQLTEFIDKHSYLAGLQPAEISN